MECNNDKARRARAFCYVSASYLCIGAAFHLRSAENPVFIPLGGIWYERIDGMESLQAISLQDCLPITANLILFPPGME